MPLLDYFCILNLMMWYVSWSGTIWTNFVPCPACTHFWRFLVGSWFDKKRCVFWVFSSLQWTRCIVLIASAVRRVRTHFECIVSVGRCFSCILFCRIFEVYTEVKGLIIFMFVLLLFHVLDMLGLFSFLMGSFFIFVLTLFYIKSLKSLY